MAQSAERRVQGEGHRTKGTGRRAQSKEHIVQRAVR